MRSAAGRIVGEHDFAAFAHAQHGRESTVRRVHACEVTSLPEDRVAIDVSGNGFLYNMVRIIAGTLVEVGRGRIEPAAIATILASKDRSAAGPTLPPVGLRLRWIQYPEDRAEPRDAPVG
jgi:tRNA pseudouridine38-40 synthase